MLCQCRADLGCKDARGRVRVLEDEPEPMLSSLLNA